MKSLIAQFLLLCAALLALNSCSSSSSDRGWAPSYQGTQKSAERSTSRLSPESAHRPGLGTTAGHERHSVASGINFYRKSASVPDAVDSFHYNDEAGAKVMLGGEKASISRHGGRFESANGLLSVALVDGWRNDALPHLTSREAAGRKVVVGTQGASYGISLENKTKKRVEVVASVDGLDVMDGKSASVKKRGYVLAAGQRMVIDGFRANNSTVRTFQFGTVSDSAASQKGTSAARNVGVIGLAVYQEDQMALEQAERLEASNRINADPFGQARTISR